MARTDDRKSIRCSFCGKTQAQVGRLIAGNGAYICDECINLCMSIIAEDEQAPVHDNQGNRLRFEDLPKPYSFASGSGDGVIRIHIEEGRDINLEFRLAGPSV